jgi:hypothetical protein
MLVAAVVGIGIFTCCNIQMWTPLQGFAVIKRSRVPAFEDCFSQNSFVTGQSCRSPGWILTPSRLSVVSFSTHFLSHFAFL